MGEMAACTSPSYDRTNVQASAAHVPPRTESVRSQSEPNDQQFCKLYVFVLKKPIS
jgi:hypothetical protein